jgi:hypothetical protein
MSLKNLSMLKQAGHIVRKAHFGLLVFQRFGIYSEALRYNTASGSCVDAAGQIWHFTVVFNQYVYKEVGVDVWKLKVP